MMRRRQATTTTGVVLLRGTPTTTNTLCLALLLTASVSTPPSVVHALWGSKQQDAAASSSLEADQYSAKQDAINNDNNWHQVNVDPQQGQGINALGQPTYGVDISTAIHHGLISNNYAWLPHNIDPNNNPTPPEYINMPIQYLGDKRAFYDNMIAGCEEHYGASHSSFSVCKQTEVDRVEMSFRQPKSMQNYTNLGFKKIKAPAEVWERVKKFWEENKDRKNWKPENWPKGNTYTNHWESPTYMVSVEDTNLRGAGNNIKRHVWDAARDTIQEWTGEELTDCSMYGIRVYTEGALLATHVDRMPLVSSAILNVDQDVDEPWPIEVYGHDGNAYNVTMEPGEMVLYESHSVLHGRPFPLKGRFYANIFIHFEPTGHSLRHQAHEAAAEVARGARDKDITNHLQEADGLPPYIKRGTVEEERWRRSHPDKKKTSAERDSSTTGSTPAHFAAQAGNIEELNHVIESMAHLLDAKDVNGWTPLHEGARGGHESVVRLLVEKGASINEKTLHGETPLYWSIKENGVDHPISKLLMELGALNIGPDL